jgi:hypothetical protein
MKRFSQLQVTPFAAGQLSPVVQASPLWPPLPLLAPPSALPPVPGCAPLDVLAPVPDAPPLDAAAPVPLTLPVPVLEPAAELGPSLELLSLDEHAGSEAAVDSTITVAPRKRHCESAGSEDELEGV